MTFPKNKNLYMAVLAAMILGAVSLACQVAIPAAENQAPPPVEATVERVPAEQAPAVEDQSVPAPVESVQTSLPAGVNDDQILVELYARVNPAVVNVTIFESQNGVLAPLSQGSGFVIDEQGYIVTNAHVVHGAEQMEVTFSDGLVKEATLVGEDLNSDLAVVQVEGMPDGIRPLELGNMESLAVGQSVVAIGNPFGLEGTLTRGIISALGRSIPALTPFTIPQAIQTDAAINPGNSGGPLLNLSGQVVGVNAQIETSGSSNTNAGVGFAIPVSIIRMVVPDLIANGEHNWAWLGVSGGSVNPSLVDAMDLPVEMGAYLAGIAEGGPSDQAGLRGASDVIVVNGREIEVGGDVVTAINGTPVNSFDDLLIYIALNTHPGDEVTLTIVRDGNTRDITVSLGERPSNLNLQPQIP